MCVDEALMLEGEIPTLRLYSWDTPTISYGYFQNHEDFSNVDNSWKRVRRLTGGGAIAHHHEITYSISCDIHHPLVRQSEHLYCHVHNAWINALKEISIHITARGGQRPSHKDKWCFKTLDPLDLITEDNLKIVGSAQRKTKQRFLMHGSIPLRAQKLMGGSGLEHLRSQNLPWLETCEQLLPVFISSMNMEIKKGSLTEKELNLVKTLKISRYSHDNWIKNRHYKLAHSNIQKIS